MEGGVPVEPGRKAWIMGGGPCEDWVESPNRAFIGPGCGTCGGFCLTGEIAFCP